MKAGFQMELTNLTSKLLSSSFLFLNPFFIFKTLKQSAAIGQFYPNEIHFSSFYNSKALDPEGPFSAAGFFLLQ